MIFELKEKKDKTLEEMYEKAMNELNDFFGIDWIRNIPTIILWNKRKDYDNLRGKKTEPWERGWQNQRIIYMINRNVMEKESGHKYSREDYFAFLKHELCHSFFMILSNSCSRPLWLNEGVSVYLSNQNKIKKNFVTTFSCFLEYYYQVGEAIYRESGFAVQLLVEKFGKEKLLELIKSLGKVKSEKDFNKQFKEIYGHNPTYTFFNKLLNEQR